MLHLIGIGAKKEHINSEMLNAIKSCEEIFLEYYTSFYETPFEELEKYLQKKITICNREIIETQIEQKILLPAKEKNIALLILGDPLIATTHTDLLLRAKEMNIKTKIYPNISIANQITKTGLQYYKFGKITSIPFFQEKFMPRTPYLILSDNQKMGAHTLFLLDLNPIENKYLHASDALQFLLDIQNLMIQNEEIEEKDAQILSNQTDAVICSRLGFSDEKIIYNTIENLIEKDKKEKFKAPLCIIIPSEMHEMEKQYLEQFKE